MTSRFRPSRAGLVNIWDYVDEEFVFADGRLVLRGHNGSGKTKALEVLFPFVLDGVTDARRLDPFSGENRTMKSNLLYRGQESEYGFVWMEFAQEDETVTLIVALRAHKDRPKVNTSFFVTRKRIGVDFGLLTDDARPLTEKHLRGVLGPECSYATATEYREAIDAELFGLGRQRYTQLIDLLLALRRPLLAKDLDPEKVSATLTAGLSPVSDGLVERAARDFDNLSAVQRLSEDLTAADGAAERFLAVYTGYLKAGGRHQADLVADRTRKAVERAAALRKAARQESEAKEAETAALEERDSAESRRNELEGELKTLRSDEAYRSQENLDELRSRVRTGRESLARQRRTFAAMEEQLAALRGEATDFAGRLEDRRKAVAEAAADAERAARAAGIEHDDAELPEVKARVTAREEGVRRVLALLDSVAAADGERDRAGATAETSRGRLEEADDACTAAAEAVETARGEVRSELEAWAERWDAVGEDDAAVLLRALQEVSGPGAPALATVFADLAEERRGRLADERADLRAARRATAERRALLVEERARIAAQTQDAPASHPARSARPAERPGGPLWELVRFADDLPESEGAALEAALDAAGLLTAWIPPDPAVIPALLSAEESDAYLRPLPEPERPSGRTLADVLVPEEQDRVPEAVLAGVLRSVALASEVGPRTPAPAIGLDGGFTYGVQVGACRKAVPEFIGPVHRAARRARLIAEHDALIAGADAQDTALADRLTDVEEALAVLRKAKDALPSLAPVLTALGEVATASALLAAARRVHAEASIAADAAVAAAEQARRVLRLVAGELDLPSGRAELQVVQGAIADHLRSAERRAAAEQAVAAGEAEVASRDALITRSALGAEAESASLRENAGRQEELEKRLSALEDNLSAPLKAILERLEVAEGEFTQASAAWTAADTRAQSARESLIRAETLHGQLAAQLAEAVGGLLEAARRVGPFAEPELRAVLGVPAEAPPWPHPTRWASSEDTAEAVISGLAEAEAEEAVARVVPEDAAAFVRALDTATTGHSAGEEARRDSRRRLNTALKSFGEVLAEREEDYRLDTESDDALVYVRVADPDGRHPVAEFAARVRERAEEQRFLLEDQERRVLEDELLAELSQEIFDRVYTARELVERMDADTRSRPMSNGTTVGIRWVASPRVTDAQREVSALLELSDLGRDQLGRLRAALRQMLRDHRAAHPRATYKEALSAVLDYRSWRSFELRLKVPGQDEVRLTRKQHSLMSGGEKSAAIHLPLFAAANALYESAKPDCPRMIALDEAFAGIDDRYKPDLLGLTVQYGLDTFMTGHDLWIRYKTVPAAAHYDMHSDKLAHTVSAMLILWDGAELVDSGAGFSGNEELASSLLGFSPTRRAPSAIGLFGAEEPA
ncbi:uncharacterized protein (TIGR02680 family) [Actinocorallia herbida]|uniref:Uncharacterized protein (TIGR02680 family) n=1 Tax=Actinocorallia herbida TaxID=58109 RepID=A0A3N1CP32_9ACTN|nr:TIGR02680 family protein [Actinocorallia herbida]ROO83033.1 uncharacterized protein (TIGR02680 family) [Actinocorallia herbida]